MSASTALLVRRAGVFVLALGLWPGVLGVAMAEPSRLLGDLNCDGVTNFGDIDPFVLAIQGQAAYEATFPACRWLNADCNLDMHVNFGDIDPFVALLTGPPVIDAELAGNSMTVYPYFEYVRAFNAGSTIKVAIDPTWYPAITGRTCFLYVVAHKNAAQWAADPSLVDVRAGGPQVVTFNGATIQDNTVTIDTGTLSGDAGTGLGVGYDVILDVNQDRALNGGDYVDGRGDEAGLYVVRDLTQAGPLATTSITYSGGTFLGQKTWYPTSIASLGRLPLVVISHGNGHDYTWYDYLQSHLASYGYVVMSHQNDTQPGIETASTTTLTNTDYFLGHLSTIGGGIFAGHIDSSRITWIGHSRGGEGVARAYDRLYDHAYTPTNFTIEDIVLVSSIAPTDFLGVSGSNPHDVTYHLIYGAADGDVGGYPDNDIADSFNVYERATGYRQCHYVQGASHNDFNCCGFADGTGPSLIGRTEAQKVAKGVYLALVKHYIEGNIPAKDFLWRQYERLRPPGVATATVVDLEYKEGPAAGSVYIDDFQTQPSLAVSSSGGAVTYDVQNAYEGVMSENDGTFTWATTDPMNGMTRTGSGDTSRGLIFDFTTGTNRYLEFAVVPGYSDFANYKYLSFRACQQTRHPQTTAELGDLTFTVSLRDANAVTRGINIGAYGGGIEEPYQRTGSGTGAGWQNEFEVIRVRLTDFLHNSNGLDLSHIVAVRFDFGSAYGSSRGRLGFDDLTLSKDRDPGGLTVRLLGGAPVHIPPGSPQTFQVRIAAANESLVPDSAYMHYRLQSGEFMEVPLTPLGNDIYEVTLPAPDCGDAPAFYFSAEGTVSGEVTDPVGAPTNNYAPVVGVYMYFYEQPLDASPGWTTEGLWAFGRPTGGGGEHGSHDPTAGYTGSNVYGYNLNGDYENSMVERALTSTAINCTGRSNVILSFYRWLGVEQPSYDHARLKVSTNGTTWTTIWENGTEVADSAWTYQEFDISSIAANQPTVYLRWTQGTSDTSWIYCGWNIDDIRLATFGCTDK